jgi:copper(I)-binding protein
MARLRPGAAGLTPAPPAQPNGVAPVARLAIYPYADAKPSARKATHPVTLRFALVLLAWTAAGFMPAAAHDHGPAGVEIVQPWAPAMAEQDRQLVYLTIRNRSNTPDRLTRALSPVATKVEVHAAPGADGEPKPIADLAIGAGQDLVLNGSGPHLALVGLKRQLLEHQTFKLALEFDVAGRIVVDVVVGPPDASDPHHHH